MFTSGVTGLLLGWKNETSLLPKVQMGDSNDSREWLSINRIETIAYSYFTESGIPEGIISRIDIRPDKGIAKVVFKNNFKELQIDCKTGSILSVAKRGSDIIEKIHDGSIFDYYLKNDENVVKLTYTTSLSIGLIVMSISGFILWLNPIRIRKLKKNNR